MRRALSKNLSGTQMLRPMDSKELAFSRTLQTARPGRRLLVIFSLAGLVAGALGTWSWSRTQLSEGPRNLRIRTGVEHQVVQFSTSVPTIAWLEVRHQEEDPSPTRVTDTVPTLDHRFLLKIPPGERRIVRAGTTGGTTLARTLHPPPPWKLEYPTSPGRPGAPGTVTLRSSPATRGRLWLLRTGKASIEVPLTGVAGDESGIMPVPPSDAYAARIRYEAVGEDEYEVHWEGPLRWGGVQGAVGRLTKEYQKASAAFDRTLLEPATDFSAVGLPVSKGASLRPEASVWYREIRDLEQLEAWIAPVWPRVLATLPSPGARYQLYQAQGRVALIEAAFRRDAQGAEPRLRAETWARDLVPSPPVGAKGASLLPPKAPPLYPGETGMPPGFFGGGVTRLPVQPKSPIQRDHDYLVTVECAPLLPEFALSVNSSTAAVLLSPTLQPNSGTAERMRLTARVPGAWLQGSLRLEVSGVAGTFFPQPLPVHTLRIQQAR